MMAKKRTTMKAIVGKFGRTIVKTVHGESKRTTMVYKKTKKTLGDMLGIRDL
jgi:(p)ppGpp synthase/HD superfamily hydrolase